MDKVCFKCGLKKPISEYYKHRGMADGHLNKCKSCARLDVKNNKKDYGLTEKGVIRVIYKTQKRNSKLRGHPPPSYSKKELSDFMYSNGFRGIYSKWAESGYRKDLKPSIDRVDSLKPYIIENIRLVTWLDNRAYQYRDISSGRGSGGKRCRPVYKASDSGDIICKYVSVSSASRDVGYSVFYPLKHGSRCKAGFFWEYA